MSNTPIHTPLNPQEFLELWQKSTSLADVAAKAGLSKNAVLTRAQKYRKLGVRLKTLPNPPCRRIRARAGGAYPPLDVDALNKLIERLAEADDAPPVPSPGEAN